jgi:hypothetical protein
MEIVVAHLSLLVSQYLAGGTEKNHEHHLGNRPSGLDSNLWPHKHEECSEPRRSILEGLR